LLVSAKEQNGIKKKKKKIKGPNPLSVKEGIGGTFAATAVSARCC
jgi:hypothetical protein